MATASNPQPLNEPMNDFERSPQRAPKRRRLGVRALVLGLLIATVVPVLYETIHETSDTVPLPSTPLPKDAVHKPMSYYCSVLGVALHCQDIQTGKAVKYRIPQKLGNVTAILPSPDGSKYIVQSAANPIYVNDTGHIWLTNTSLEPIRELDAGTKAVYSSVAWVDEGTVALARRDTKSAKTNVVLTNVNDDKSTGLDYETTNTVSLSGSAGGDYIIVIERGIDKPALKLINRASRKAISVDTGSVTQSATSYANATYDYIRNTFYLTATSKNGGKPVVLVAKLSAGSESAQLKVDTVIDDSYSYDLIGTAKTGVFASRQQNGSGAVTYGTLQANGTFADTQVKAASVQAPSVTLGLVTTPGLAAIDQATIGAADFLAERVAAPLPLHSFLDNLVSDPACPVNRYSYVELLAQDGTQAAVQVAGCNNDPAELRYYTADNGSYRLLGKSYGIPGCQLQFALQLSDAVVPSCKAL